MTAAYVHGYEQRESIRLQDQASSLVPFDQGIADLLRTTRGDGVFCYTFFKATALA